MTSMYRTIKDDHSNFAKDVKDDSNHASSFVIQNIFDQNVSTNPPGLIISEYAATPPSQSISPGQQSNITTPAERNIDMTQK